MSFCLENETTRQETSPDRHRSWRDALFPAIGCALLGVALVAFPLGDGLSSLGYDLAQIIKTPSQPAELIIIYLDDPSFQHFGQTPQNWDRRLYANLLAFLTREKARLVVLDVWLSDEGPPEADRELAQAIRDNGRVVLAAKLEQTHRADVWMNRILPPRETFARAAAAWGLVGVMQDSVARRYYQGDVGEPSLPWAAATLTGARATRGVAELDEPRWLNYYGPPGTLRNVSFAHATNTPPGFYRDKCVFVGSQPRMPSPADQPDEFRTPHTLSPTSPGKMPGVEIMATGFLNLQDGTWLRRMSTTAELAWIVALGLLAGGGLTLARPGLAMRLALLSLPLVATAGLVWTWAAFEWSAWTIPVLGQIPLALGWAWLLARRRWSREKADLESKLMESVGGAGAIPDHTLLRRIGRGGYGEVWLARNATGMLRAVKLVRRRWFQDDRHYEREFAGIRNFLPVAGAHPGLVHVHHVGRRDAHGYFYYVMEVGDDATTGQTIDPDHYTPNTLAHVLRERGRLPADECRELGIALADALQYLHDRQLIHRDIKPANIVFVRDQPKLADIGLVTELDTEGGASKVGTPGYVAPEGPGPAADIYALGLVLYQAITGMDVQSYPELPTAIYDAPDYAQRKQLIAIIGQACAHRVEDRYASPAALRDALRCSLA